MSEPLAVYVHIPFCTVKCGYCDFNAYAGLDALKGAYQHALVAEVAAWAATLAGRRVTSVSFGGGTPSEVPVRYLAAVIEALASRSHLAKGAEISVEVNPGTLGLLAMRELRAAGVNRVSFGVQSFNAEELRLLDRTHSPEAGAAALSLAREAGFTNVSLDLIYGLPGQAAGAWLEGLDRAIQLVPEHLSCYALTIEPGTPFARHVAEGDMAMPDPDTAADCYESAEGRLAEAGYTHYEISNWARPGFESRHNLVYWIGGEYLGIGAGAHGYLGGRRYENVAQPRAYIAASRVATSPPWGVFHEIDPVTRTFDWLETRLRLVAGFRTADFEAEFGRTVADAVGESLDRLRAAGLLTLGDGTLRLTARGRLLHSEVCVAFLTELRKTVSM